MQQRIKHEAIQVQILLNLENVGPLGLCQPELYFVTLSTNLNEGAYLIANPF